MAVEIIDCTQGSPEWFDARRGIPTASRFKSILAKGQGKMRYKYMCELASEIYSGDRMTGWFGGDMQRGHDQEDDARKKYAFMKDADPILVGFVRNGPVGCSPDSFLEDRGLLEIKTMKGDLLVDVLLKDKMLPEHVAQVQGQMWVCEREWCDLAVFCPNHPLFVHRCYRDTRYIMTLKTEVDRFGLELEQMVEQVRARGKMPLA